jgi:hypothetical protein
MEKKNKPVKRDNPGAREKATQAFRSLLDDLERKSQEAYDKAILTLSGGALGVTISFVKDVVCDRPQDSHLLLTSWSIWGLSLLCILFSHFFSQHALRKTIKQLDAGTLGHEPPGGWFDRLTVGLNTAAGLFFLVGTFVFVFFAYNNMRCQP